jgi:peptide/nickel transport system permease protein
MRRVILRRLAVGVLIVWLVSIITFVMTQLLTGDAASRILQRATPEEVAALRERLGLNAHPVRQYLDWLGGIVTGDLGDSLATQKPVTELLGQLLGNSLVLMAAAALVSSPIAILAGTYSAMRRDRAADHVTSALTLILAALPEFVVGIVLIMAFATGRWRIFPAVSIPEPGMALWSQPKLLALPTITLAIAVAPPVTRMMRATMIEVLESEYVQMARLKGVPERTVILRHAVPNAIGPVAQVMALQLAWLAGGVVVVEFLFGFPGIGAALVDSVDNRDLPVVQAVIMVIAAAYVLVNILADLVGIMTNAKLRTAL